MMIKRAASPWLKHLLSKPKLINEYLDKIPKIDYTVQDPAKRAAYSKYVKDKILKEGFKPHHILYRVSRTPHDWFKKIQAPAIVSANSPLYALLDFFAVPVDSPVMRKIRLDTFKKLKKRRAKYLGLISKFDDLIASYTKDGDENIPQLVRKYLRVWNSSHGEDKAVSRISADINNKLQPDYSVNPQNTIWSKKSRSVLEGLDPRIPIQRKPWLFGSPHYQVASGYHTKGRGQPDGQILLKINPRQVNSLQVPFDRTADGRVFTTPHLAALPGKQRKNKLALFQSRGRHSGHRPKFDRLHTYQAIFKLSKNPLLHDIPGVQVYTSKNNQFYKALIDTKPVDKQSVAYSNLYQYLYPYLSE